MSTEIEKHYINTYTETVKLLAQQKLSKLEPLVTVQPANGQGAVVADQFGTVTAREQTERFEDTKYSETPRYRRWLSPRTFYSAELVEQNDIIRLLSDPKSPLAEAHVAAMNRQKDGVILAAAFGLANIGETPTTGTQAYDSSNDIAANIEDGATATGLTPTKLIAMNGRFAEQYVDIESEKPTVVIPVKGWKDMFANSLFTSGDYNDSKVLKSAPTAIDYGGMNLVRLAHASFPVNGTTEWYCPSFVKSGIVLGVWSQLKVEVNRLPQKVETYEVKVISRYAATRVDEMKVGRIKIKYA